MATDSMQILHKPQHPSYDTCSKSDCQTMVDCSSVRTIGNITTKFDEKLRDLGKDVTERMRLVISNEVLKVKDDLHSENRQIAENMHVEIRKILDERLAFLSTKLERNMISLDELQATVAKIKSNAAHMSEDSEKETRSVEGKLRVIEDDMKNNTNNLSHLTDNVKKLFDEYNKR